MGAWIAKAVAKHCPDAVLCVDPFHVIKLATEALDVVRREVWNEARRTGHRQLAKDLKGSRFALWKNRRTSPSEQKAPKKPPNSAAKCSSPHSTHLGSG